MSAENLIQGILENDLKTIRSIYQEYLPGLIKYVQNNKGTEEDARDVFQDALLIIFSKLNDPSFELKGHFKNYLFGICKNLWLRKLKKKSKLEVTFTEDLGQLNEKEFEKEVLIQERENLFFHCIDKLETSCKAVLKLFFEKIPLKVIAQQLGYTEKYIKQKNYQCKQHLAKLVESDPRYLELMTID